MVSAKSVFIIVGVLVCLSSGSETPDDGNVKLLMKLVTECGRKDEMGACLKMRALTFLDKLVKVKEPVPIGDYVTLVRDPNAGPEEERSLSESELESSLPRSIDEKDAKLDEMLWDKVVSLFSKRRIQLTIPTDGFEGRGDKIGKGGKKGMGGLMMMMGMMMGMKFKMILAKIALIAGKALLVAKISLILSLIMILKKWAGSHHAEVIYDHHGGHRRSASDDSILQYAQDLAYSAQKPNQA